MIKFIQDLIAAIMAKLRRIWSSMVFRISMTIFILISILGWGFTEVTVHFVRTVRNINICETTVSLVSHHIEGELERVESVMKTAALNSISNNLLTPANSGKLCENVRKTSLLDTVYVSTPKDESPSVAACIADVYKTGKNKWSEPHYQPVPRGNVRYPVVTFVTPLRDSKGNIYAVLCGDMRFEWLRKLARTDSQTEKTSVIVSSAEGLYLCHPDSTQIMTTVISDVITEEERGANSFFVQEYHKYHDPHTSMSHHMEGTGWDINVGIPFSDKSVMGPIMQTAITILLFLLFAIITVTIIFILRWQLRPLRKISDAADAVSKGDFEAELPVIKSYTDIKHLRDSFEVMQVNLKKYIEDLRRTTEKEASMERDLQIAAKIQQDMVPKELPDLSDRDDLDVFGMLKSAREVGGDLFDCFIKDEQLIFCLGDVSGKGVPAALLMTVIAHLFRNIGLHTNDPSEIASAINQEVSRNNESNMFCTLFIGVLDLPTGTLHFCNAGHNPPVSVVNGKAEFMPTEFYIPVGLYDDFEYHTEKRQMQPHEILILYSDGVTEAENPEKELYGDDRTIETITKASDLNMKDLAEALTQDIKSFVKDAHQSDDMTLFCLRYK